ncbi:MAG: CsbD family protein [Acidimicrobiales bacterium]|jgi:uncharacterized protein YjbJ (UPF0337 family)
MANRASAKATEIKGKAKELAGKATDDRSLEAKGKGEQLKGRAATAGADLKSAARKVRKAAQR